VAVDQPWSLFVCVYVIIRCPVGAITHLRGDIKIETVSPQKQMVGMEVHFQAWMSAMGSMIQQL
jgi:hypothetical protein